MIEILRERLGVRYPLAHARPFVADRRLVLAVQEEVGLNPELRMVRVDKNEQLLTPPAAAFVEKVEFTDHGRGVATRLFPYGSRTPTTCSSRTSKRPCPTNGRGPHSGQHDAVAILH